MVKKYFQKNMWLSSISTAEWLHWLFCEAYAEGQDWWLEEELEGSLWKSGWEKMTGAMQPAVGTHPCKERSSIPDQFRRVRRKGNQECFSSFPSEQPDEWRCYSQMESTEGAGCRRVPAEVSVAMPSCLCLWDSVGLHSATRCTRLELEWEVCLGEKDEGVISLKSVIEAITVENVAWGIERSGS